MGECTLYTRFCFIFRTYILTNHLFWINFQHDEEESQLSLRKHHIESHTTNNSYELPQQQLDCCGFLASVPCCTFVIFIDILTNANLNRFSTRRGGNTPSCHCSSFSQPPLRVHEGKEHRRVGERTRYACIPSHCCVSFIFDTTGVSLSRCLCFYFSMQRGGIFSLLPLLSVSTERGGVSPFLLRFLSFPFVFKATEKISLLPFVLFLKRFRCLLVNYN